MSKKLSDKKYARGNQHGWEALKTRLQAQGLTSAELEEAYSSFGKGVEVLSRLFLSFYSVEKQGNARKGNSLTKPDKEL